MQKLKCSKQLINNIIMNIFDNISYPKMYKNKILQIMYGKCHNGYILEQYRALKHMKK